MAAHDRITLYHSPNTRSSATLLLLEELGAPYELHAISLKKSENRQPAFLAVNPLGKVPAIRHGDAIVTETVACFLYLADLFPAAGLAPAIGDPARGPFLRWMVYYAAAFEPAVIDRAMKREAATFSTSPYGDFDSMLKVLVDQLAKGPYLLGDKLSAADILWGSGLAWTTMVKLVPELPEINAYTARLSARPAQVRARAKDAELAARLDG